MGVQDWKAMQDNDFTQRNAIQIYIFSVYYVGHQKWSHIEDRKYRNFIRLSTAATFRTEGEEVGSVAEVKGMMLGKWKKHPDAPDKYARCTARSWASGNGKAPQRLVYAVGPFYHI